MADDRMIIIAICLAIVLAVALVFGWAWAVVAYLVIIALVFISSAILGRRAEKARNHYQGDF